jgi:molybdate transport system ATP-binding protein
MTPRTLTIDVTVRQGTFALDLAWDGGLGVLGMSGPSGSGKTTILEIIAGLRRPVRGRVVFDGRPLVDTAKKIDVPSRDRRIGYAPQDAALFPHLTVRQNVLYGARRASSTPLGEVMAMLEVESLIDRPPSGLSGGERQRIALARALLSGPTLLLLDEPLAAVDTARRRRVLSRLNAWLKDRELPAVHVSHDAAELAAADHVLEI